MKNVFFVLLFLLSICASATHNRAGEILYKRIEPFTQVVGGETVQVFNYLITVVKYTNDDGGNQVADRCVDTVNFGDGTRGFAPRINGSNTCGQGCPHCGILISLDPDFRVKINTFTITHTYSGAGSYTISSLDPNRNAGVRNMQSSDQVPFYIESFLTIDNFTGANSSPEFKNPPTDRACYHQCFYHNPGAYDVDGDSLSFEITPSRTEGGATVPGYFYPSAEGGSFGIDAVTGLLSWCTPQYIDEYNIAFIVREWRKNTSGNYQMIGYVLRDMQVIVRACTNNGPPTLILPPDTCVEAGTIITKTITINDSDPGIVALSASGGAFASPTPNAFLSSTTAANVPFNVVFTWSTSCNHIREQPYQTVFKATDSGVGVLVNFATYSIKVVPPSVKNVTATAVGSSIRVDWSGIACNPAANPLTSYKVYRKNDCSSYTYTPCKTGIDPTSGFELIGTNGPNTLSFTDNNGGNGLVVGQNYSYLVVAVYSDGTTSYGSSVVCAKLKRDIPVLLNVDIRSTSVTTGSVFIRWSRPLTNIGNLDTVALKGPYKFNLLYRSGNYGALTPLYTTTNLSLAGLDTSFNHINVNTNDSILNYAVEFVAGTTTVGSSPIASSVFLKTVSADRQVTLNWTAHTPWNNTLYTVFRKNPSASTYTPIATTSLTTYTDTDSLVNRFTYCYKILSNGQYSDPSIFKPLLNNSQEVCALVKDLTPPCSPTISIDANCLSGFVKISWTDVRPICSDDVLKYTLFYKPTIDAPYALIDTLDNKTFSFTYDGLTLISGCYAMQAIDSSGNASKLSPDFCLDNCPIFELPNIFTPNGDNANDFYKAVKVRQIKEIDLVIYDRWGNLVYKTRDPYFMWDGVSQFSKNPVSEGTFFYSCDVYEPRLTGIRKRTLTGYLQVVR